MKKNKILITVGAGYIGSHSIIALIDSGFNPIVIDNFGSGKGYSVEDIIQSFEKINKIKIPGKIKGRRNGDLPIYYTCNKKAKIKINFKIKRNLN